MDSSDKNLPVNRSPRRELQGPRPAPLKVRKDSHKIVKKPPLAPPAPLHHRHDYHHHQQQQQPPQQSQPRAPVIIYTVSPKVIHTSPNNFMNLVQRLTGLQRSSSDAAAAASASSTSQDQTMEVEAAISPAARYASIEKTKSPDKKKTNQGQSSSGIEDFQKEDDHNHNHNQNIERSNIFPGVLSPGPTSLPTISPNFFSPPSDPNLISYYHDFNAVVHGNRNYIEGSFMPSPSSSFLSPTPSFDIFNNFFDYGNS